MTPRRSHDNPLPSPVRCGKGDSQYDGPCFGRGRLQASLLRKFHTLTNPAVCDETIPNNTMNAVQSKVEAFHMEKLRSIYSLTPPNAKFMTLFSRSLKTHVSANCGNQSRSTPPCTRLKSSPNCKLYAFSSMPLMCYHSKTTFITTIWTCRASLSTSTR